MTRSVPVSADRTKDPPGSGVTKWACGSAVARRLVRPKVDDVGEASVLRDREDGDGARLVVGHHQEALIPGKRQVTGVASGGRHLVQQPQAAAVAVQREGRRPTGAGRADVADLVDREDDPRRPVSRQERGVRRRRRADEIEPPRLDVTPEHVDPRRSRRAGHSHDRRRGRHLEAGLAAGVGVGSDKDKILHAALAGLQCATEPSDRVAAPMRCGR